MNYPLERRRHRQPPAGEAPGAAGWWRPVDRALWHDLGTPTIRLLQSRTSDTTRRRISEQATRMRYGRFTVGIEVLPTKVVAVVTDQTGDTLARYQTELPDMRVGTVVREIDSVARYLVRTALAIDLPSPRVAIGVQIGGPVRDGVVLSWQNHPSELARNPHRWTTEVPLAALVERQTGCRTVVENDAAAYAVYEQRFGVGLDTGSFLVILVRDGVGGGIVLDHRVLSVPFEFGHLTVRPNGRRCSCDLDGCIESLAGRRAMLGIIGELIGSGIEPDCVGQAIELADKAGDPRSDDVVTVFREAGEAVARGIAGIVTLFGVSHVVVYCDPELTASEGKRAVDAFLGAVRTFPQNTFPALRGAKLATKPWRSTDGALGAALVALNQLFFVPLSDLERTA